MPYTENITAQVAGWIVGTAESSHANAITVPSGTASQGTGASTAIQYYYAPPGGRGGGATYRVTRSFFQFSTKTYTVAPTSAVLFVRGWNNSGADLIAVRSGAFTGYAFSLQDTDINNIVIGTPYSSEKSTWSISGWNEIPLNAAALADIGPGIGTDFQLCLMEHDHDYSNSAPVATVSTGMYFLGSGFEPYLQITPGGYLNDPLSIDMNNRVYKVNGVESGDISEISGA
jgi:hypothetical protein